MKSKWFKGLFLIALLVAGGYAVSDLMDEEIVLSDLAAANVEALANGGHGSGGGAGGNEGGGGNLGGGGELGPNPECPNGCLDGGVVCHCYHDYLGYREAVW